MNTAMEIAGVPDGVRADTLGHTVAVNRSNYRDRTDQSALAGRAAITALRQSS